MVPEAIRIKFSKTGRLRYISHLDLCRTMQPAMIRARIPLWYTEGFNPHPKMVFAQPLPLFVESRCEFLDIKIVEDVSCEELKRRLREAFTDELYVLDVYKPTEKFTEIAYAVYEISGLPVKAEDIKALLSGAIGLLGRSGPDYVDPESPAQCRITVREGERERLCQIPLDPQSFADGGVEKLIAELRAASPVELHFY